MIHLRFKLCYSIQPTAGTQRPQPHLRSKGQWTVGMSGPHRHLDEDCAQALKRATVVRLHQTHVVVACTYTMYHAVSAPTEAGHGS